MQTSGTPHPQFGRAFDRLAGLRWGEAVALGLLSLGTALALHPLQYAMVQVLEGYWGSGRWPDGSGALSSPAIADAAPGCVSST